MNLSYNFRSHEGNSGARARLQRDLIGKYPNVSVVDVRDVIVATLSDETGRQVHSEKLLEIVFANGKPVRAGDQFGLGRAGDK